MPSIVDELRQIVTTFADRCSRLADSELDAKPNPTKWSKKEVLGHLIDSAHNNLRRFIVAQHAGEPPHIVYDQDFWVKANNYQNAPGREVIEHWRLVNEQMCRVLESMPPAHLEKQADTGRTEPSLHSIHWLAADYLKHMKHHLNQIFAGSFDVMYV